MSARFKIESGKKQNQKYLETFAVFYQTEELSHRAIDLIDQYSNTYGLMLADAQIADVCLENDLTLVTYNVKDFLFIAGLKIITPPFPTI